ncbi:HGGxSTG domain-containing protein [Streptomyces sp. B1866]|nr:HGGxSTG domain-containing protein [Streptomyces sp. B1866]MDT3398387.1 HGGxSTG domain-containing protein [Streptomyces sp. B1866]
MKCGARTRLGTRCRNPAMIGSSRCHLHQGPWAQKPPRKRKKRK